MAQSEIGINLPFTVISAVLFISIILLVIQGEMTIAAIYASAFFIAFMLWAGFSTLINTIKETKDKGE